MAELRAPRLSVVVPSVNGWGDLEGCLAALHAHTGCGAPEVIVVDRVGETVRVPLRRGYPGVRLLEAPPGTTIPALRARGLRAARGEIVGVIEDHVLVPPDWGERMLAAHAEGWKVVAGAVENAACSRTVDWAAFLCEYSHCLVPATGPAEWLTGNNVTYRRELLEEFREVVAEEQWEHHLHEALRAAGVTLMSRPEIRVGHRKHYTVREYLHQRYLYSRSYAGLRAGAVGGLRRFGYGLAAFALPPVLLFRIVARVRAAHRHGAQLVRALPLIGVFVFAWAGGEVVGSWRGPGDSLSKVC